MPETMLRYIPLTVFFLLFRSIVFGYSWFHILDKSIIHHSKLSNDHRSTLYEDWDAQMKEEKVMLQKEEMKYKDLVFVSNVETYRNLPNKMLQFYVWYVSFNNC